MKTSSITSKKKQKLQIRINQLKKDTIAQKFHYRGRGPQRRVQEDLHQINQKIRAREVRLVGDNVEPGVYPLEKALEIAKDQELDLVVISDKAEPFISRILDYKKFLYEQKKKQKELKSKQVKVVVKEIRFGPQTDEHDYDFKKKHAEKFLEEGSKLKTYVFFKGRSIIFKDQGEILLLKLAQELEHVGKVDQLPKLEGKRMIMMMSPKKPAK